MDFQTILNSYILPTGGLILMGLISWGIKELTAWLKEQKAKAKTERKKMLFGLAMSATEEIAHQIEKSGSKMKSSEKEATFKNKLTEFAKNESVTINEGEIDSMLKAILGETRLNGK